MTTPITRPAATATATEHVLQSAVDGTVIHYIDAPGAEPTLVALHGLSANARCFGGLIAAGLSPAFRVVAPDLRGRGKSGKPATGYTMADHASDVLALMDHLGLRRVVLAGHSFGGYLAIYVAARFPERVEKLIVMDAAIALNPRVAELIKPSLDRLSRVSASVDAYLAEARSGPHLVGFWDDAIERFYRAEIQENPDGTAQAATSASAIGQAMASLTAEPWPELVASVKQPTLLLNAREPYGPPGTPPLVEPEYAKRTAEVFPNVKYVPVPGNHMTMVFGDAAPVVNSEIEAFVRSGH
ncbi:MAG TPA: alpha/beta hydrolase [Gemmatimonadaceae bacterium]|jgi:pimeloyl-ACP methyl ester carboxylesterase|nr:alpha/beta hydrolase [Gemmatimonadaceae bacterium]